VTPYPYPTGALPPLKYGAWHRTGWVGAVLPGSRIVREESATGQRNTVRSFLDESIVAGEALL
jgi:hypothetical protein